MSIALYFFVLCPGGQWSLLDWTDRQKMSYCYWCCLHSMRSRVYETCRVSVYLSVCPSVPSFSHCMPLQHVSWCEHGGQEISVDIVTWLALSSKCEPYHIVSWWTEHRLIFILFGAAVLHYVVLCHFSRWTWVNQFSSVASSTCFTGEPLGDMWQINCCLVEAIQAAQGLGLPRLSHQCRDTESQVEGILFLHTVYRVAIYATLC